MAGFGRFFQKQSKVFPFGHFKLAEIAVDLTNNENTGIERLVMYPVEA